jgi:hypothetical protein
MNTIKKLAAIGLLGMVCSGAVGCAYAGMAATPDGTVYVARNDLFFAGLLRKMYACKAEGGTLVCSETSAP